MSKINVSIHKDIKIIELDTDKQYALIFPEYTTKEEFEHATNKIKEMGVDKFISVNKHSGADFKEMRRLAGK